MKAGIVMFPGSNCDKDAFWAFSEIGKFETRFLWHEDTELGDIDIVILPGGFSYGDYLRTGAFAKFSPVMKSVADFADSGGLVLGICNGFQILCESGLLEGALLPNTGLRFLCKPVHVSVENIDTPFTCACSKGDVLEIPIAHFEGNYYAEPAVLAKLEAEARVLFRYCDKLGRRTNDANPNGSVLDIAGICSSKLNVCGLMPHPERAVEDILGSSDGEKIIDSIAKWIAAKN